jgi:peroxiredoxin
MNNKWISIAAFVIAVFLIFFLYRKYRVAPEINFSELRLSTLNGSEVNLKEASPGSTILSFGASWCGSCVKELRELSEVTQQFGSGVKVIVISDESTEKIKSFSQRHSPEFLFLKLDRSFAEIGINSIPTTYIIDEDFKVRKKVVGYINWKDPSTMHHLKSLMEGSKI